MVAAGDGRRFAVFEHCQITIFSQRQPPSWRRPPGIFMAAMKLHTRRLPDAASRCRQDAISRQRPPSADAGHVCWALMQSDLCMSASHTWRAPNGCGTSISGGENTITSLLLSLSFTLLALIQSMFHKHSSSFLFFSNKVSEFSGHNSIYNWQSSAYWCVLIPAFLMMPYRGLM